jgi:proteasome lid subunit RPN8/RPN11
MMISTAKKGTPRAGSHTGMFHGLVTTAHRLLDNLQRSFLSDRLPLSAKTPTQAPPSYQRLRKVVLTDEVSRTLFQEYTAHREGNRGDEEIGWVLLGQREVDHAVVLATLPAGTQRNAGVAHVQFNSSAQALASRIVRQWDKRLTMLGVVHTHPGSLRHPSAGDYQGDSQWVGRLRGGEGIFGIGTADGPSGNGVAVSHQPLPHVQTLGGALLSWYTLARDDRRYRPVEVELTLGPDLALPLHGIWPTLETFAESLERLCVQQAGVSFQVVSDKDNPALGMTLKLAEPGATFRVVMADHKAAYYLHRGEILLSVDPPSDKVDQSVYLILAELAGQS